VTQAVPAAPGGRIREPAVAGSFYPADRASLAEAVDALLRHGESQSADLTPPRALVVPHAGYRYSGRVAALAYATLGGGVRRAVLVGPAHFVRLPGCAVPEATYWRTPLGLMPVDLQARDRALQVADVWAADGPHEVEHSLEVQLPFLQRTLAADLPVLPVVVRARPDATADLLDAVAGQVGTLVIASTDLSHYLPLRTAHDYDTRTASAVLDRRPDLVADGSACGVHALRGLLIWARRHDLEARLLARATSADAGGDPSRVVGYAAFAIG
jgi:MEMO1 family protein